MKNKLLALLLTLFLLTGCNAFNHENENKPEDNAPINGDTNNDGPTTPEDNKPGGETNPDDSGNTDNPGEEGQGGEEQSDEPKDIHTILHCWDWSISNIRDNLESIKNAGFDMIQLSPLQPQQSPQDGSWPDQWWKLYQPRGFKVAENNENKLGNKQELIALCSEAEEQGIDVIVDIVANHLSSDGSGHLAGDVRDYEPTIYNNNLIHQGYGSIDDDVIKGNMGGLCDLMTEDSRVQERVKSLLKEYIDCGIDGFRFDAAKHIETEFDVDEYKSDFWKNTLDVANTYYKNQYSKDLFSYGEVLGETGPGRQYSYYTCRMDITDSEQGDNVLKLARGQTSYFSRNYNTNCQPEQLVLWGESHDTFANDWGESKDDDLETIQKAYFIQSSRKDASVLYFARPNDRSTKLGQIGDESYKNTEVKAINIFRLLFNGKDESLRTSNGCFVNVRGGQGAAIVRVTGSILKSTHAD